MAILSSRIDYAYPDIRPATVALTFAQAAAEAGVTLRDQSGAPNAPTMSIEAVSLATDGTLKVTLVGGGQATIALPTGVPQVRRLAVVSIDSGTSLGTAGYVTCYWGSESTPNS